MTLTKYLAAEWRLEFSERANKDLEKLEKNLKNKVVSYFEKTILKSPNPRNRGKALSGNLAGQWSYRIGTYRVLTKIQDEKLMILAVGIGHRKEIYKKF